MVKRTFHTNADTGLSVNGWGANWTNVQLQSRKLGQIGLLRLRSNECPSVLLSHLDKRGYVGCPVHHPPEVQMSSLKARTYPFLITAIGVIAATGGAWRIH